MAFKPLAPYPNVLLLLRDSTALKDWIGIADKSQITHEIYSKNLVYISAYRFSAVSIKNTSTPSSTRVPR